MSAAVQVATAFVNSRRADDDGDAAASASAAAAADSSGASKSKPRPFIYISAEDIFRPIVPSAYIDTKRQAEEQIDRMIKGTTNYRGVYMRPSEWCLCFAQIRRACRRERENRM
jgi:hypothetical protein